MSKKFIVGVVCVALSLILCSCQAHNLESHIYDTQVLDKQVEKHSYLARTGKIYITRTYSRYYLVCLNPWNISDGEIWVQVNHTLYNNVKIGTSSALRVQTDEDDKIVSCQLRGNEGWTGSGELRRN